MSILPVPPSSEDDVYHVYALRYARNLKRRVFENFQVRIGDAHDGPMPVDYNVWIVTNARRTILVDTGFGARAAAERGRELDFDPIDVLPRLGVDPALIEDVILSHLHYDHAGNLDRFGRARLHVQEAEVEYATGRCMCEPLLRHPFDIEDITALIRRLYEDRVVFHGDGDTPFPGISLHQLPGHSMGMQAVKVTTPRGPVLLASDVTHYYANFLRREPFRITVDARTTLRSYTQLMKLAGAVDRIIPGHDPKVRRYFPLHSFGGVEVAALHEAPLPHTVEDLARTDDY